MMHTLAPQAGARTKSFRVGRGHGSGRGKTAGRGTKGQRSRSGGRNKLKMKGMKQMLLSFPKWRGFQSRYDKARAIRVEDLSVFADGARVTMATLRQMGLINRSNRSAKIVAGGSLSKKLTIAIPVTAGAKSAIEAAGGMIKPAKAA